MEGGVHYLYGNQYAQVFSNWTYFSEIYKMAKKSDVGQSLNIFVIELSVHEKLTVDGSKEQNNPGTEFMKCCRRNEILLTKTDPDIPNHNPAEGVIR